MHLRKKVNKICTEFAECVSSSYLIFFNSEIILGILCTLNCGLPNYQTACPVALFALRKKKKTGEIFSPRLQRLITYPGIYLYIFDQPC